MRSQTKREHIAAGHLRELDGVQVFCPRLRYRKATRRGKIWWIEPLFPGYLLAKFKLAEMERAVTFCQGVRGLVRFGSGIPPVPDSFVEALRNEVRSRSDEDEELFSVSPVIEAGDEVEIAHGPLQGMHGTILSVAPAAERVKILLDFLGQPQAIDVDLFSILLPRRPTP
ncbi:MAG: transcription termination/antitermination NusG family protein [Luteolibacter sp.]|nr:transcription termination/antitermination NusG family protein [Luteolibacter sp.]